ncbi:hypothetical protein M569_06246, partial [Genlisea aurea]
MGASHSRLDEDKGLQLCLTRKKLIKQALNGRCSLAAAHISYIEELKLIGSALRSFVEADYQDESPRNPAPEPHVQSPPQVDATADVLSSPSASVSTDYKSRLVKFRSETSFKVEEAVVVESLSSNTTPRSNGGPDVSNTSIPVESAPWDYFGLSHPIESHVALEEQKKYDDPGHNAVEDVVPEFKEVKGNEEIEELSQFSEGEFDEASSSTLARSFKNINKTKARLNASEVRETSEDLISGSKFADTDRRKSPELSPLRATSSTYMHLNDVKIRVMENNEVEDNVVPKDFISSIKDIEQIFVKASESGQDVPRMLEANKFHFRPVLTKKQRGFVTISFVKSCFTCGMDPSETPREPSQNSVKYLTWHRSTSSRNLLGANSMESDLGSNLFENSFMNSGSHASTLDRLYAWEKKLYDEVKAAQILRNGFDQQCKTLRRLESNGEPIDKTRAVVKDLHSRIGVSIHRINWISKNIEEIRDTELQLQLEELIEGLLKMWERMLDCHKLQLHIVSVSHAPSTTTTFSTQSDHRREMAVHLENGLTSFLSTFTKWIDVQKLYVESIDRWLQICVSIPQKTSKRNKRTRGPRIRDCGPPIYMMCDVWIKMLKELPCKEVVDSAKELSAEVSSFFPPRQEKKTGNQGSVYYEERRPTMDRLQTRLVDFLGKLSWFAEACVGKYAEVRDAVENSKNNY